MDIKALYENGNSAAQFASLLSTRTELRFSFADTSSLKKGIAARYGGGQSEAGAREAPPTRPRSSVTDLKSRRIIA